MSKDIEPTAYISPTTGEEGKVYDDDDIIVFYNEAQVIIGNGFGTLVFSPDEAIKLRDILWSMDIKGENSVN